MILKNWCQTPVFPLHLRTLLRWQVLHFRLESAKSIRIKAEETGIPYQRLINLYLRNLSPLKIQLCKALASSIPVFVSRCLTASSYYWVQWARAGHTEWIHPLGWQLPSLWATSFCSATLSVWRAQGSLFGQGLSSFFLPHRHSMAQLLGAKLSLLHLRSPAFWWLWNCEARHTTASFGKKSIQTSEFGGKRTKKLFHEPCFPNALP